MLKDRIINVLNIIIQYSFEGAVILMIALCAYVIVVTRNWFYLLYIGALVVAFFYLRKQRKADFIEYGGLSRFIKSFSSDERPSK